jgi:hypothetical protein
VLPQALDLLTAAPGTLATYDVPSRPAATDATALSQWLQTVGSLSRIGAIPTFKVEPATISSPNVAETSSLPLAAQAQVFSSGTSGNWSGWVAQTDNSVHPYTGVFGNYKQPAYHAPKSGCTPGDLASWTGLGGANQDGLLQAGTSISGGTPASYGAWYEYIAPPNSSLSSVAMTPLQTTVHAGDQIDTSTVYNKSMNSIQWSVIDTTTHTGYPLDVSIDPGYWSGKSAEWIDERPAINNTFEILANYGTNTWTGGYWDDLAGNAHALGTAESLNQLYMANSSNHVLSGPSDESQSGGTGFVETWYACK